MRSAGKVPAAAAEQELPSPAVRPSRGSPWRWPNPALLARILWKYYATHRRLPHLFPPRTYNEKIQYRKLFDRRPHLTLTSDKYAVRSYAREKLGVDLSPQLHYVTTEPETIPFDELPGRFVVKPTHGSGWLRLVFDKNRLDRPALIACCRVWLRKNHARRANEWGYANIPRRILIEELLDDAHGRPPPDIKLLTFGGRVRIVQIDRDRFGDHRRDFYDVEWNNLGVGFPHDRGSEPFPRPSRLDDMIRYAEILGRDSDFVRIDFYQVGERIYLGEITHYPGSGLDIFYPAETDLLWGDLWEMDYAGMRARK